MYQSLSSFYFFRFSYFPNRPSLKSVCPVNHCKLFEYTRYSTDTLQFEDNACVCVVLASDGYPVSYEKGFEIKGLENFKDKDGYYCFHAGSAFKDGRIVTNGGRVLGVTALGKDLFEARANAYKAVDWVDFENKYYRHDIAKAIEDVK